MASCAMERSFTLTHYAPRVHAPKQVVAAGLVGKRLMYRDLVADNGLSSGARS